MLNIILIAIGVLVLLAFWLIPASIIFVNSFGPRSSGGAISKALFALLWPIWGTLLVALIASGKCWIALRRLRDPSYAVPKPTELEYP